MKTNRNMTIFGFCYWTNLVRQNKSSFIFICCIWYVPSFAVCFATAANATGTVVGIMLFCIGCWSRVEMGLFAWEWSSSRADDDWICEVATALDELIDDSMLVVDDVDGIVGAPDTLCWVELAIAGEALCDWFLLGVEHTVLIWTVDVLLIVEFRSDLFARTAVGFTG